MLTIISAGGVNGYLLKTSTGFILIDTLFVKNRAHLKAELDRAGCQPGNLNLIILTHGDFDHTGNAAYLREVYGAKIAMHKDDIGMAEVGDMFYNRRPRPWFVRLFMKILLIAIGQRHFDKFTPDVCLDDGQRLTEFGLEAQVISLPGHSKGSIGILTSSGDLFCGDLFENRKRPQKGMIIDDPVEYDASIDKLKGFDIQNIYPGHGKAFTLDQYVP
jgi:glyoxylase-like metal-dependent hydrolase (beta-lactamase superfamily II)